MYKYNYIDTIPPHLSFFEVNQGWLYLLEDTLDLKYLKVGKSSDLKQRLNRYNTVRPVPYCRFIAIAGCFEDVHTAEKKVVQHLQQKLCAVSYRKEWFLRKHQDYMLYVLEQAEKEFKTVGEIR